MGVIQCGAFIGNTTVTLGWEPQFIMFKRTDAAGDWVMIDSSRGCSVGGVDAILNANLSNAESSSDYIDFTATGFVTKGLTGNYIYTVIRRPNKPPTTGTEVYNAIAYTGNLSNRVLDTGFVPDMVIGNPLTGGGHGIADRLRGSRSLYSNTTDAEFADNIYFDSMVGVRVGNTTSYNGVTNYATHFFRRAPGFFSQICYTGTGSNKTEVHDLTKAPSLMIVKSRSSANDWNVWCNGLLGTEKLVLNSTAAKITDATAWNSTTPTSSVISLGTAAGTNANAATYVAYLFSNLAGIQSIGTYIGDGTSGRLINCGFTTGSRYVCIKAISTTGDWLVADSTRGITSGNDPYLFLDSTAAEVTTEDWLDPHLSGFLVNQTPASNANVNGVTYMYWSIA